MSRYDPDLHADPAQTFFGYSEGEDSPQGIADYLTDSPTPRSYWIVGEPRMGRTSFLLKLGWLLTKRAQEKGHRCVSFPLYVTCAEHQNFPSFCKAAIQYAQETLSDKPLKLSFDQCQLLKKPDTLLSTGDALAACCRDLQVILGQMPRYCSSTRIVLLVDDADTAFEAGWGQEMAASLRDFFTSEGPSYALSRDQMAVVIASTRQLEGTAFDELLNVLHFEVRLRALPFSEVHKTLTQLPTVQIGKPWAEQIYHYTAGHPWLIQYILRELHDSYHWSIEQFEQNLDYIVGERFQQQPKRTQVLEGWVQQFPERGTEIIMRLELERLKHLAAEAGGQDTDDIAKLSMSMKLSPREVEQAIRRMQELGVVYEQPLVPGRSHIQYAVGGIFSKWYLERTGGAVLEDEIQRLLQAERGRLKLDQPFTLLINLSRGVIVANGLYVVTDGVSDEFGEQARDLIAQVQDALDEEQMNRAARQLKRSFVATHKWYDALKHYWGAAYRRSSPLQASFVFQVEDRALLDFPIEFVVLDEEGFLFNNLPVYKELVGAVTKPVYRLQNGCFADLNKPLNVLLVANGAQGIWGDKRFDFLPETYHELENVCKVLLQHGAIGQHAIGQVICLSDNLQELELPDDSRIHKWPSSSKHFGQALRGELNNTEIHILHYSGHYHFDEREDINSGFVFVNEQGSAEVFNERQLDNALQKNELRLVYLSACRSGQHRPSTRSLQLGPAFVCLTSGVPVVIGMRWPIRDREAKILSGHFYEQLVQHGKPELALFETRTRTWEMRHEVQNEIGQHSICWAAPVMLTR